MGKRRKGKSQSDKNKAQKLPKSMPSYATSTSPSDRDESVSSSPTRHPEPRSANRGFGPLPQSGRESELQELSLRAFKDLLPVHLFVVRDERVEDYGVDASIELKIERHPANLRAQVQLKSTDGQNLRVLQDGVVSISVKVANLNYLLNGVSPIYVLYIVPRNELRYVWAREEFKRLNDEDSEWMSQESITLHFRDVLTSQSVQQIYEGILQEARMRRNISDITHRAGFGERIVVGIDTNTLETSDPHRIEALLAEGGLMLVDSGHGAEVLAAADLLNPNVSCSPRVQLVRAAACYTLARYSLALGYVSESMMHMSELSADDYYFGLHLRDACRFETGQLSLEEYARSQDALVDAAPEEGTFAVSGALDMLRHALLKSTDPEHRAQTLFHIRELVDAVLNDPEFGVAIKTHVRLLLLECEGDQVAVDLYGQAFADRIRLETGRAETDHQSRDRKDLDHRFQQWKQEVNRVLADTATQNHPLLHAHALSVRATLRIALLLKARMTHVLLGTPEVMTAQDRIEATDDARAAADLYRRVEHREGELRAQVQIAEVFELYDELEAAKDIARQVLPKAQAMEYDVIETRARNLLTDNSLLRRFEQSVAEMQEQDPDVRRASDTDSDLRSYATHIRHMLGLPVDRLPVLERAALDARSAARERLQWCRHLQMLEDRAHVAATQYSVPPRRVCGCELHHYTSPLPSPEWKKLVAEFKNIYCRRCSDRNPKSI